MTFFNNSIRAGKVTVLRFFFPLSKLSHFHHNADFSSKGRAVERNKCIYQMEKILISCVQTV